MNPNELPGEDQQALKVEAVRIAYLIAGYLKGTITPVEHDELDRWVEESDRNMHLFEDFTDENNFAGTLAWAEGLQMGSALFIKHQPKKNLLHQLAPYAAAACLLAVVIGVWWWQKPTEGLRAVDSGRSCSK
jgi:transmembrane sensor